MPERGNETVMARCEFHCAHRTDESKPGMLIEVYCCWCGKTIDVAITVKPLPLPGHGRYSSVETIVYDWPRGWGLRKVAYSVQHNLEQVK